jgi:hypothetical protein
MSAQILQFSILEPEVEPDMELLTERSFHADRELHKILQYLLDSANRTLIEESLIAFRDYWGQ